jgi:hypothetical protein
MLSVASLSLAKGVLVGESNAEHAQQVAIGGLHVNVGFHQGLPFLDHPSESGKEFCRKNSTADLLGLYRTLF